ncbi:MAG: DUF1343 domain-containing protein [Thermodesulfobacteriaceae bacterium]|nr:DUF1343 domain-containing protein [Thermodesulfobacteriaceae bacterium]
MKRKDLKLGVEVFFEEELFKEYEKAKIALLTHQAATNGELCLTYELFYQTFREKLKYLFSPQHGLFSEKQANMHFSSDEREPFVGIEVKSLYGNRLAPHFEDLKDVELIFVDLVDVGCRVYTYIWTLFLLMKTCEQLNKEVVILDRPNPLGRTIEGPLLEEEFYSFVGYASLPQRHGLTIGEIAIFFQKRYFPNLTLRIIPMKHYNPLELFSTLKRFWVPPSPNLPLFDCALVYPGMVYLEGTNLSEGRGTTLPFLTFGAPYLKIKLLYELLRDEISKNYLGIKFKPIAFEPTFDKWMGKRCYGFQIFITNPHFVKTVELSLFLLKFIKETHEEFDFLSIHYEFETKKKPIEILIGNREVLFWLMGEREENLSALLNKGIEAYQKEIQSIIIYK